MTRNFFRLNLKCDMLELYMNLNKTNQRKSEPISIAKKNLIIQNIFNMVFLKNDFLLLGHEYADEDCIASLVAMALLLRKFKKEVYIFLVSPIQEPLKFLIDICTYNKITVLIDNFTKIPKPDAIFILDTPKPDMIAVSGYGKDLLNDKSILKIELDHHFSLDADYSGDVGYRLTMRASSTCEIIAHMCVKLSHQTDILEKYRIDELYSRNIVLSMLTGMMGDAKLGNYLFKKRDKAFFSYFLHKFNRILNEKFYENTTNICSIEEILKLLDTISEKDYVMHEKLLACAKYFGRVGVIALNKEQSEEFFSGNDQYIQFLEIIKRATNTIAEKANGVGLSAYFDPISISDKIQFRMRASESVKGIDFGIIIKNLKVLDGGGHPRAVGFRFPRSELKDFEKYILLLVEQAQKLIEDYE